MQGDPKVPSPEQVLAKAQAEKSKIDLQIYAPAMEELFDKGWSLREIASWMTKELSTHVGHTQVRRQLMALDKLRKEVELHVETEPPTIVDKAPNEPA